MKRSAKDFHTPLLRVLGRLSGWRSDEPVPFKDAYDPIMAIMDIPSLEAYGINEASGHPNVVKWIQWAYKNLKGLGLTSSPSRGQWALTEKGLGEARHLNQLGAEPSPSPALPALPLGAPESPSQAYSDDPYLVFMGARTTPCYSHYSDRSPLCKSCPLRTDCKNARWAALSHLARTL